MYAPRDIETLCRPVFICICDYWQLNEAGMPPPMEKFRNDIENALKDAKYRAESNSELSREFESIELPLVFFIDYMVTEGNFPFKNDWRELARNYNELSGDEKFFNLLTGALHTPDGRKILPVFYTMLALGFDGIYVNDNKAIEKSMKQCIEKLQDEFDVCQEPIIAINTEKRSPLSKTAAAPPFTRTLRKILVASFIFAGLAFLLNFFVFLDASRQFRESLSKASAAAQNFEFPNDGATE
jgi:type VI protein secretion system component VasF